MIVMAEYLYLRAVPVLLILFVVFFKKLSKIRLVFYSIFALYLVWLLGQILFPIGFNMPDTTPALYPPFVEYIQFPQSAYYFFPRGLQRLGFGLPFGFLVAARFRKKNIALIISAISSITLFGVRGIIIWITRMADTYCSDHILFFIAGCVIGMGIFYLLLRIVEKNKESSAFLNDCSQVLEQLYRGPVQKAEEDEEDE